MWRGLLIARAALAMLRVLPTAGVGAVVTDPSAGIGLGAPRLKRDGPGVPKPALCGFIRAASIFRVRHMRRRDAQEGTMGNGTVQGRAWGRRAHAWAELQEHNNLPLHQVVPEAARIGRGTTLLDAGCGAGLSSALATFRGATVTAVDAAPALLAIARARIPGLAAYEADLETLPFADGAFDAAIAINSLFFCADAAAATREVARTVRPGGLLVATC